VQEQMDAVWERIRRNARGDYPPEAYRFVRDGLAHTVRRTHKPAEGSPASAEPRHVTGQQLCLGLREFALDRYGLLARAVFEHWGIERTDDFGNIVYAMIDAGLMRKNDTDRAEDFCEVYAFEEAFPGPPMR
jgi:uncharacterized repeat protein (TIGR04138 family)